MALNDTILFTDCQDQPWVDLDALYMGTPRPCIVCSELTHRYDFDLGAFVCDNAEDDSWCKGVMANHYTAPGPNG